MDFFYGVGMTQGYQLDQLRLLYHFFDNVLLELVGLPHVLPLTGTVHLDLEHLPNNQGYLGLLFA